MTGYTALALLALVTLLGACRGSIDERFSAELEVYNDATGEFISDGDRRGTLNLAPGDTVQLRVMRIVDEPDRDSTTDNVTSEVDWNVKTAGVATISPAGLLTASAAGETEIVATFDDGDADVTDNDEAMLTVVVAAAAP